LQLCAFLCLSAALPWIVWLWPVTGQAVLHVTIRQWRINWPFANLKLLVGNCLPGLLALVWVFARGKQEARRLLSSLVAWRTQFRWYVLSVALPSSVFLVSACIVLVFFPARFSRPSLGVLAMSLVSVPFGPLWEEIAWRAFALRELQGRYSRLVSALILGVYWAAWHIPLWMLTLNYLTMTLLLILCCNLVSWSVIFSFLYNRSRQSLPVVILLHATYLAVQNEVFAAVSYRNILLIPISAALSVCLAAILARRLAGSASVKH
jgi:uncharacterized protein